MCPLDCESFDSALRSCAAILGTTPEALLARVKQFKYDGLSPVERRQYSPEELFLRHTFGLTWSSLPAPSRVYWFHATRVARDTTFEEGLLPMPMVLDRLWHFLGQLASEWLTPAEWQEFRRGMRGQGAQQYRSKASSGLDKGPFAFLVREVIFSPGHLGNHDYLAAPEIVEDICLSFNEMFCKPLRRRFLDNTCPCIVKFWSDVPRADALGPALLYVHRVSRREHLSIDCNTCFDGGGVPVPVSSIVRVDWPQYQGGA